LLASARELFARKGYDGASIRAITRRARANLGSVTYHFGSKQALFNAVIASSIAPLRERVLRAAGREADPLERIDQVVAALFEHYAQSPELPRLILQVLATGRCPPPAAESWIREAVAVLSGLVRDGQREGSIRPGDPLLMAVSIVSQPFHFSLVRLPLREIVALDQDDPSTRARVVDHAARFVRGALAPTRGAARASAQPSRRRSDDGRRRASDTGARRAGAGQRR
jgi:AcrR family transcriptional regulator